MTQQALISPNEPIFNYAAPPVQIGVRIAQTVPDGEQFEVAEPLFWAPCADTVDANTYYWDGENCVERPAPPPQTYALISPNDKVYDNSFSPPVSLGNRIVEVSTDRRSVPSPLFWTACASDVTATGYYWDGSDCVPLPVT